MAVAQRTNPQWAESFAPLFHRVVCWMFSLRCEYIGEPADTRPVLYVANHTSYLDVFVLGAILRGAFVAKSEVASWPVFGALARLQNTLFLERNPGRAAEQVRALRARLVTGQNVIVFPEGTSTVGTWVAPFRSSLFEVADVARVQPISVAYVGASGEPLSATERDRYAWYLPDPVSAPGTPNRPFLPHFLAALGGRGCTVRVLFHEPLDMPAGGRKQLAAWCETRVRQGLERLLADNPASRAGVADAMAERS